MAVATLAQGSNGAARISTAGLRRLLARLSYYGAPEDALLRWAEVSVPVGLRPVSVVVEDGWVAVTPIEVMDLLIEQAATRESPWVSVLWGALGTVVGTVLTIVVTRAVDK